MQEISNNVRLPEKLTFVDVETTGTSPTSDRIIEIGVLRVENGKLVNTFHSLVNPETYISPYIEAITGIKTRDVENAPTFATIAKDIKDILDDSIFVSHNVRFDYSFMRNEFLRNEQIFSSKKFCTVKLSRALFPNLPRHNLDSIISHFGIVCNNRHRAYDDAEVIWKFYQLVLAQFSPEEILPALALGIKKASFPVNIHQSQIDELPQHPGVYIFRDNNQTPIYIGKSVNIHDRVLSHFTQNDVGTDFKITSQVADIESITTAGELGALILEAQLVKTMQPIYNKKLRRFREMVALVKATDKNGFDTVEVKAIKETDLSDFINVLGVFKNKRQATNHLRQIAKEYQLCPKLLNLEKSHKVCMHYQFGWCKGACKGIEKNYEYNLRLLEAFSKTKINPWPFAGPIEIHEENQELNKYDRFIVNNWTLVDAETFDLDIYKILKRYLKKNHKKVKLYKKEDQWTDEILSAH